MPSRFSPPPIIKAIERLLVDLEQAVRVFPRYHRYQIGADIRRQGMRLFEFANRATRDRAKQAALVGELVWAVDTLRHYLQMAKQVGATISFRQFEHLIRQIDAIGRQAGGWKRQLHPSAQNAQGPSVAQRGQKLSTRDASAGANP